MNSANSHKVLRKVLAAQKRGRAMMLYRFVMLVRAAGFEPTTYGLEGLPRRLPQRASDRIPHPNAIT
jgi:hypothetical protein